MTPSKDWQTDSQPSQANSGQVNTTTINRYAVDDDDDDDKAAARDNNHMETWTNERPSIRFWIWMMTALKTIMGNVIIILSV